MARSSERRPDLKGGCSEPKRSKARGVGAPWGRDAPCYPAKGALGWSYVLHSSTPSCSRPCGVRSTSSAAPGRASMQRGSGKVARSSQSSAAWRGVAWYGAATWMNQGGEMCPVANDAFPDARKFCACRRSSGPVPSSTTGASPAHRTARLSGNSSLSTRRAGWQGRRAERLAGIDLATACQGVHPSSGACTTQVLAPNGSKG